MILVTGGAAFIGANFVLDWQRHDDGPVLDVDKLAWAGDPRALRSLDGDLRHVFTRAAIYDRAALGALFARHGLNRCALRRRKPRRSSVRWSCRFRTGQCCRHVHAS